MKPEDIAGPAAVKALQDAGYTLVAPKEPARLVTMEESGKRWEFYRNAHRQGHAFTPWKNYPLEAQEPKNAADDWLVKTVNRRIIDHLLPAGESGGSVCIAPGQWVSYRELTKLFCGEGA